VNQLSKRQIIALEAVWSDSQREPDAVGPPQTDNAAFLALLDSWIAGVISSQGQVDDRSLQDLLDLADGAKAHPVAHDYFARVVDLVMPNRTHGPPLYTAFADTVREHCEARGYTAAGGESDRFGYRYWDIEVPHRQGRVRLSINGEVFLLNFPGGFMWADFGYSEEEAEEALADQLQLLDAYADPATQVMSVKRILRPRRSELHISDGTVLWRRGGKTPRA
jgi:hypothetical protein